MVAQIPILAATSTPAVAKNSNKRPASPSHHSSGGGYGASKKKKLLASSFAQGVSIEAISESKMESSEISLGPVVKAAKLLPFKDPNFVANYTDPQSKLCFSTVEEFSYIPRPPSDVVTG